MVHFSGKNTDKVKINEYVNEKLHSSPNPTARADYKKATKGLEANPEFLSGLNGHQRFFF